MDTVVSMDKQQLSQTVSQLSKVANARVTRLEKSGVYDISIEYGLASRGGGLGQGRFSAKGKNRNELLREYKRVSNFLKAETSTVRGTLRVKKDVEERVGRSFTADEYKEYWNTYDEFKNSNRGLFNVLGSERIQKIIAEQDADSPDIMSAIRKEATRRYTEMNTGETFFRAFKK